MKQGSPIPDSIRLRIIQLILSDAFKHGEINLVIIARRVGCSISYVKTIRKDIKITCD